MKILKRAFGRAMVLTVEGPVTKDDVDALEQAVKEVVESKTVRIVLEMKGVPFLDSVALERIWDMGSRLEASGGGLRLATLTDVCKDIVTATRLQDIIQVFDRVETAVKSLVK